MVTSGHTAKNRMQPRRGAVKNPDRESQRMGLLRPNQADHLVVARSLRTELRLTRAEIQVVNALLPAGTHLDWSLTQPEHLEDRGVSRATARRLVQKLRGRTDEQGSDELIRLVHRGRRGGVGINRLSRHYAFTEEFFRRFFPDSKFSNCTIRIREKYHHGVPNSKYLPDPPEEMNPAGGARQRRPKAETPTAVAPEVEALAREIQALPGTEQVNPRILAATLRRADLTPEQAHIVAEDVRTVLPTRKGDTDGRRLTLGALSRSAMRADIAAQAAAIRAAEALRQAVEAAPEGAQTPEDLLREAGVAHPQATLCHLAPEAASDLARAVRALLDARPRGWLSAGAYLSTRLRDSQAVVEALTSPVHEARERHRTEEAERRAEAERQAEAERPAREAAAAALRAAREALLADPAYRQRQAAEAARRQAAEAHWDALAGRLDSLPEGERDWARLGLAFRDVLGARCLDWTELLAVARFVGADEKVIRLSLPPEKAWDLGLFQDELPTHLTEAQALSGVRKALVVDVEEALAA